MMMMRSSTARCLRRSLSRCDRVCRAASSAIRRLSTTTLPGPSAVTVVEVGPRDGLQNETATPLTVDQRVDLVKLLAKAGCRKIEVGSFVSPQWVPAMADSDLVYRQLAADLSSETTLSCLVPNARGMQQAQSAKVDEIAIFAAASETFSQKVGNRQTIGKP